MEKVCKEIQPEPYGGALKYRENFEAMAYEFQRKDDHVYGGTVEGSPSLEDIMIELKAKGTSKAWLMPLMSVAGDHVRNAMAGDVQDSWTSILAEAGIEAESVLKGMAEFNNIVDIWVSHLKKAFSHF